jgi:hypothetical protein
MSVAESESGPVVTLPGLGRLRPLAKQMLDFRNCLARMDKHEIDRQIVSLWLDVQATRC